MLCLTFWRVLSIITLRHGPWCYILADMIDRIVCASKWTLQGQNLCSLSEVKHRILQICVHLIRIHHVAVYISGPCRLHLTIDSYKSRYFIWLSDYRRTQKTCMSQEFQLKVGTIFQMVLFFYIPSFVETPFQGDIFCIRFLDDFK